MKKIISMFLILSLISGCDKVNTLKPIQPVKNHIVQSNDNQVSQSNNNQAAQPNNNQNTEINKQKHYSTGSTVAYIVGGVIVLALAGYVIYRRYHQAKAPSVQVVPAKAPYEPKPKEEERKVMSPQEIAEEERRIKIEADHNTFGGGILPRDFSLEDISLLTEKEREILAERQEHNWYKKNYNLLLFIYVRRCRRDNVFPILTSDKCLICHSEKTRTLLDEYQKEMVFRRASSHLIPLDAIPIPKDPISPLVAAFPNNLTEQYLSLFTPDEYRFYQNAFKRHNNSVECREDNCNTGALLATFNYFYEQLKEKGVSVAKAPSIVPDGMTYDDCCLVTDGILVDEFKKEMVRRCTGYQPMDFVDE